MFSTSLNYNSGRKSRLKLAVEAPVEKDRMEAFVEDGDMNLPMIKVVKKV